MPVYAIQVPLLEKSIDMEFHLRSVLQRSSIHGLPHLAAADGEGGGGRRWSLCLRCLWAAAILASFSVSAYLVAASIKDAHDNPVFTITDYIPIQGKRHAISSFFL